MLTNLDNFLLFHLAAKSLYAGTAVPGGLAWFGIFCAKWLIFFIPLHLLWLNFRWIVSDGGRGASCPLGRLLSPVCARLLLSILFGLLLSFFIGCVYYKARPFMIYPDINILWHKPNHSFPSDHATIWGAYIYTLYKNQSRIQLPRYIMEIATIAALLTCFGRVFVGVHYPFDVLGGAVLGALCGWLVEKALSCKNNLGFFCKGN